MGGAGTQSIVSFPVSAGDTVLVAVGGKRSPGGRVYDSPHLIDFTFTVVPGTTYWIAVDGLPVETACSPMTGQCNYTTPTGRFPLTLTV